MATLDSTRHHSLPVLQINSSEKGMLTQSAFSCVVAITLVNKVLTSKMRTLKVTKIFWKKRKFNPK